MGAQGLGTDMITLGWRERVDLPDWGIRGLRAKVDTGARTSAVDVAQFEHLENGDIRFEIVTRIKPERRTKWIRATPIRTSFVKPSHGEVQERPVCLTRLRIGDVEQEVEIGLVCRKNMLCRMLVGRTALEGRFLVDVAHRDLCPPVRRNGTKKKGPKKA